MSVNPVEPRPRHKPYPKCKDSGVEWLGEIPVGWEIKRLKRIVQFRGGGTPTKDNLEYWRGEIPWVSPKDMKVSVVIDTEDRITAQAVVESVTNLVPAGAVLLVVRSGILAHSIPVALAGREVALNQDLKALMPSPGILSNYLIYLISGKQRELLTEWKKEGATVESLELDLVACTPTPVPGITEQRGITAFLDRETARIDGLVAKKERLIELLQEKRSALITRAVTKGLDPNVPMKDSGVEWLGEIPAHWKACALRHVIRDGTRNGLYKSPEYHQPGGTPMIQMGEAFASPVVAGCATDRLKLTAGEMLTWGLGEGDLLFARRSLVFEGSGKCSIVGELAEPHVFESSLIRVRPDKKQIVPHFLFLYLQSSVSRAQMLSLAKQVTISGIDSQQLKSLCVVVPPKEEQESIVNFIRLKDMDFHALISKVRTAIDRLRELRTALFSAAVTGKIDVRGETP
jgi:type I restriction enzyme S subunit